jgi:V/A-type H+-transporting ATPase subunit E
MSIESLVDKIMSDTKRASSEIEKKATDEARACDEKTKEEIQRIEKAGREKAARLSQERKQRMISMAELEDRKNLLGVKQEVIEEAFSAAVEKVLSFDPEYYGDFLINLILQADPQGTEEILVNETDRARLGNGWVGHLNQRLEQAGKKSEMAIGDSSRSCSPNETSWKPKSPVFSSRTANRHGRNPLEIRERCSLCVCCRGGPRFGNPSPLQRSN